MIPKSKPQATKDAVIDMLIDQGLWTNRDLNSVVVVGIRGYYLDSMGAEGKNDRGIYDDAFFIISPTHFESFNGNTDPSRIRQGMAMLEAPQVIIYQPGWHGYGKKSGHQAFRQSSDVVVMRDGNIGNGKYLGGNRFRDSASNRFWTNLHRGGNSGTSSEGCQTLPVTQWSDFEKTLMAQLKKYNQDSFKYYLIENKK